MARFKKLTEKQFYKNIENIKKSTPVDFKETSNEKIQRKKDLLINYKKFFQYYFPQYAKSESAWFHVFIAHLLLKLPVLYLVLEWFRGSAKSTHACMGYPFWLKCHGEMKTMLLVGQTEKKAQRLIADIQAQLMGNQRILNDYGKQVKFGSWQDLEFITTDGCAFFALGIGQSPRGTRHEANRPDYIVADDCDNKMLSKNQARINEMVEWIFGDLIETFDIGRQRFLLVNNRPFKNSILGDVVKRKFQAVHKVRLTKKYIKEALKGVLKDFKISALSAFQFSINGDWYHLRINACDKNYQPTWEEKYTPEHWIKKEKNTIRKSWSGEFMNTPVTEGVDFKEKWIKWEKMPRWRDFDQIVAYGDPSWKNTKTADFKAIPVWGKIGTKLYKIKQYCRKDDLSNFIAWFYDFHESLPDGIICEYWIEANFMQDLIMDEFDEEGKLRGYILPIRGDTDKKDDKYARITSTAPIYKRGHIIYNIDEKENPDMKEAVEQLLCIEPDYKTPDDAPDADHGAISKLQKGGRRRQYKSRMGRTTRKNSY